MSRRFDFGESLPREAKPEPLIVLDKLFEVVRNGVEVDGIDVGVGDDIDSYLECVDIQYPHNFLGGISVSCVKKRIDRQLPGEANAYLPVTTTDDGDELYDITVVTDKPRQIHGILNEATRYRLLGRVLSASYAIVGGRVFGGPKPFLQSFDCKQDEEKYRMLSDIVLEAARAKEIIHASLA